MEALATLAGPLVGCVNAVVRAVFPFRDKRERPNPLPKQPETRKDRLDAEMTSLKGKRAAWASMEPARKASLLRRVIAEMTYIAEEAAIAATQIKGAPVTGIGEELLGWASCASLVRELCESLESIAQTGAPQPLEGGVLEPVPPFPGTAHENGPRVKTCPRGVLEHLVFGGMRGELWLTPQCSQTELPKRAQSIKDNKDGGVCVILGAGNQMPAVVSDILHLMVNENHVVCLKFNPMVDALGPYLERAFEALIDAGFLFVCYGGVELGQYALHHPAATRWHLTGSSSTYNMIVWGKPVAPPMGSGATTKVPKHITKVTGELGCVTPYVVVPWRYSADELAHMAKTLAAGLTHNASHNCLALEVLVTSKTWPQRDEFLKAFRKAVDDHQPRLGWYAGSKEKHHRFVNAACKHLASVDGAEMTWHGGFPPPYVEGDGAAHRLTWSFGSAKSAPEGIDVTDVEAASKLMQEWTEPDDVYDPYPGILPWVVATGVPVETARRMGVLDTENWCGCMTEVPIDAAGGAASQADAAASFLEAAARFCNDEMWGTLSCCVLVPPGAQRNAKARKAVDTCVASLRYGTICVNCPTMVGFGFYKLAWGAFGGGAWRAPGSVENTEWDIGSGNCFTHNTLLVEGIQKSVIRAPFKMAPHEVWLEDNRNMEETARRILRFLGTGSFPSFCATLLSALRG